MALGDAGNDADRYRTVFGARLLGILSEQDGSVESYVRDEVGIPGLVFAGLRAQLVELPRGI